MLITLGWNQILLRLALAVLAGGLLGFDRSRRGRPAGIRTTLLVCLAATIAMLQANLLMDSVGKRGDSFVVLDLMRFPLGILSGIGFIGAGTIIRRGEFVQGLTTAATLWFVTVIGLAFGGGQIGLGLLGTALGWAVLLGLRPLEGKMLEFRRARLTFSATAQGPGDAQIRLMLSQAQCEVLSWNGVFYNDGRRTIKCRLQWRGHRRDPGLPPFVKELAQSDGVWKVVWNS